MTPPKPICWIAVELDGSYMYGDVLSDEAYSRVELASHQLDPLYSAAQLEEARREAYEECAKRVSKLFDEANEAAQMKSLVGHPAQREADGARAGLLVALREIRSAGKEKP